MNNILKEDIQLFASRFALATELEGKTIAVTGSTGLLGACMVCCLLALKAQRGVNLHIVAVVRNMEKAVRLFGEEREELSYYQYDFSATEPFQPKRKVDYLFHFAAPTTSKDFVEKPVETMNTIYMGMQNILNYAEQAKLESLVLASTLEVYGTMTDAISAMLYILLKGEDGTAYNVANEATYISIRQMAELVAETFNPNHVHVVIEMQEGLGYSPTTKLRLDTQRIQSLGWTPYYNIKEMFHRLIASMKEE